MNRGEIWMINLDPTIGPEIKKIRPAIIINSNSVGILPLRVIIPLTDWKDHFQEAEWMVKIKPNPNNALIKDSAADTFQVRSLSTLRFIRKLGEISREEMEQIVYAVGLVIEYPVV